jgi:hypothetical protein
MFDLAEIVEMNRRAVSKSRAKVETNFDRACSYNGDANTGVVLHSARLRNTVFLRPSLARHFIRRWNSVNSQTSRNRIVESYFE